MVKFNRDLKTGDIFIHYHIAGKRFRASTGMRVSEKNWTGKWAKSSRVEYNGLTVNDELAHCQQCLVMATEPYPLIEHYLEADGKKQ